MQRRFPASNNRGWISVALASLVATAPACGGKKDDPPTKPAGGGEPGKPDKPDQPATPDTPKPVGKLKSTPAATASLEDLNLLPVDAELVMGVNVSQIMGSAVWKQLIEPRLTSNTTFQTYLANVKTKCGFDPMVELKSVAVGMRSVASDNAMGHIVAHGLDKTKTMACLDKMKDDLAKEKATLTVDGDIAIVKPADDDGLAVKFIDDTTAFIVLGPTATKDGVTKALQPQKFQITQSPMFVDLYNSIDPGQTLWLLMNGNSKVFEKVRQMKIEPKGVAGSIRLDAGAAVDFRMRVESPDSAKGIVDHYASLAGIYAKDAFDKKFEVTTDGPDVKLTAETSPEKLPQLKLMFK